MVGRDVLLRVEKPTAEPRRRRCSRWRTCTCATTATSRLCAGCRSTVRAGEIVALAGVDGNGQHELVEAIAGLRGTDSGRIAIAGKDVTGRGVRATTEAGVAHIAEDRQLRGLVLDFTLAENLALREYREPPLSQPRLAEHRPHQLARPLAAAGVRRARRGAPSTLASSLSGGNQQKVCIAREIASEPEAADRPPAHARARRGRDRVRPPAAVDERETGRGVLLVSLESEEVRSLADRILVIYEGEIVGEFPPEASEEELGVAMTGGGPRPRRERAGREPPEPPPEAEAGGAR